MNAIVSMTTDGSIGRDNKLIYKISDDLRRFKKFTEGHVVVMGRNTFESLPSGPLKNRINVVFTSGYPFGIYNWNDGKLEKAGDGTVIVINEVSQLQTILGTYSDVWCIGGGKLYSLLLPFISRIEITEIQRPGLKTDIKFPRLDENTWNVVKVSEILTDSETGLQYIYKTATRKNWP